MASLNFTKKLRTLFSFGGASTDHLQLDHENISSSSPESSLAALQMLSRVYFFQTIDHFGNTIDIGLCKVVSVAINCNSGPEICLLPEGKQDADFYNFSDLEFCLSDNVAVSH